MKAVLKILLSFGLIISLTNLSIVIWEVNIVFAELNEERSVTISEEDSIVYTDLFHEIGGAGGITTSDLFTAYRSIHYPPAFIAVESPPPEV